MHEVTIPVRYSESAEAFAEIFTAAAAKMGEEEHEAMMNEIDAATNVARATLNDGDSLSLDTSAKSSVSGKDITSQAARALEALKRGGGLGPNPFEEKINLFIPRGQLLEGCRLEIVVWHLDKHARKKVNMMGMRLFEGAELVNLFKEDSKPQSDMILAAGNEQNSLGKSGSSISSGGANGGNSHLNTLSNGPSAGQNDVAHDFIRPDSTPGAPISPKKLAPGVKFATEIISEGKDTKNLNMTNPVLRMTLPQEVSVYDLEAPPDVNDDNLDGIALAAERLEMVGKAEADYVEVSSGLNLGVRAHKTNADKQEIGWWGRGPINPVLELRNPRKEGRSTPSCSQRDA